jgi:hypothetical protein
MQTMTHFVIDDHESIFEKVFPEPAPEGLDQYELEELNSQDAEQVSEFDSEVNGFAASWVSRCFYYVFSMPSEPASHYDTPKVLLNKFAQENIETAPVTRI